MSLQPRFRRVAALDRRFVDREDVLEAFTHELRRAFDRQGPRVFNVTGVGGIGKSRLLRELKNRAAENGCRTALLDLQVPAMRQQEDALAVLRMDLGRQGVIFDHFDIAYAVLWQRLHPHLKISQSDLPFAEESEILTSILDETSGLPVFGTAVGLLKLAQRARSSVRHRRVIKDDEILQRLDELSNTDVLDAVTYLFAQDLRAAGTKPHVVFVDAYEALVPIPVKTGRVSSADAWLRDLIAQLDHGLVVMGSREPLGWQVHDPEWADIVRECPVDGLPMAARLELLKQAGISEGTVIAQASQGLPFYLHLALDTQAGNARAVSLEEILQRFLNHVAPAEVRLLELLSISRTFDFEIFHTLAAAFDLPGDRITWESLTAYSFVYPAGQHGLRLHQLMVVALRERLSTEAMREVHAHLRAAWDARATTGDGTALREAVYHGVRAGVLTADDVLSYADRSIQRGGKQAGDGILADLTELGLGGELAEAARCLRAEAAITMGNAAEAAVLTDLGAFPNVESTAGARLAMAAAHAKRLAGDTTEAGHIYSLVWERHQGPVRPIAGLWVAEVPMWQGRFATAFSLAEQVLRDAPEDDWVLRGDVVRLMHLGYRFHLDFDDAVRRLEEAHACYARAGSVVGLANIATNRVELAAWNDPVSALRLAAEAIRQQEELSAVHELGKTYTALALAQMRLDDEPAAFDSFALACEFLERAGYRSGRARAELFRAFLHVRRGAPEQAARSLVWAAKEFIEAEVYPTLIVAAHQALARIGLPDAQVTRAAEHARGQIEPLDSLVALESRLAGLIDSVLGAH
ncbi:AAA family ATPase [Sphaerisporangium perillae]|uniref:AAA family ATPase n=1 Tax=Sphaerisporangium perillae TaxID=2935860 RepID=UPI00200DD9E2|nr:ATP-binding protein [Sphaerisporangium perillae]